MNTIKIDKAFKGMVAYRGLSGIETENTIFSFLAASNRSYFGISCDISLSKDKEVIVTADETLLRLGLLNLYIPSFTYKELKKFSLIDRKTSNLNSNIFIPKLSDYLSICKAYRKESYIHIDNDFTQKDMDKVLKEIDEVYDMKHVNFISKNKSNLEYLIKKVSTKHVFFKTEEPKEWSVDYCKKTNCNLYLESDDLDQAFIKELHLSNLKIAVGEVSDKLVAEKLVISDVDLLFTSILE